VTEARFAAFAATYAEQHRPVWAYLVRLGATRTVAEDLAQEVFVKWLNHAHSVDEPGQTRAFLFTVATRLLIDQWRRERRFVSWDSTAPAETSAPVEDGMISGRAWGALTQREQQLLWLAYAEEFSHSEIAGITGLAPASIKVLLSRSRARLKAGLTPREGQNE
jgi:RNA polymerase sigma-70 factor (ECF subfamily)